MMVACALARTSPEHLHDAAVDRGSAGRGEQRDELATSHALPQAEGHTRQVQVFITGQRRCALQQIWPALSALGLKQTSHGHLEHVRFTPKCVAKLDCSWRLGSAVNFGRALVQLSR